MIEQLKNVMVHTGAGWVIWVLAALSTLCLAVSLERAWYLWRRRAGTQALVSNLHQRLLQHDLAGADLLLRSSPSVEAVVVAAGLAHWGSGPGAAIEAMSAAKGVERARLERRIGLLGTVGNNAPFIGLLGTVIGVVGAFQALGQKSVGAAATGMAPELVMQSIAEALVTTAVGLVVAIPAVAIFNYFQNLVTVTVERAETLGHVLLSHLEGERDAPRWRSERPKTSPEQRPNGTLRIGTEGAL